MVLAGVVAARAPGPIPKCDDCNNEGSPADATHWCPKCEAHFCSVCVHPHFAVNSLKKHPVLPIDEHRAAGGGALGTGCASTKCHLHHKPHEYFCRSCHAIGCAACIITGHNGEDHDTGLLEEMVVPLRLVLKQCGVQLGVHCSVLHAGMDTVQATLAAVNQNEATALVAAEQAAKELHQEVNRNLAESKTTVGAAFGLRFPTFWHPL
jgi:hypothetical protein